MEIVNRKSIYEALKIFSPIFKEEDFIDITEWTNGEGWDITISCANETKIVPLHRDELEAINYLIKVLEYENSGNK